MKIGNVILELRTERGISQKALAEAIGVGQSTIAQIELARNEATASTIRKLSAFFDVSADYLLGLEDDFGTPTAGVMHDSTGLTEKEKALLKAFKNLLPETQDFILKTAQSFSDSGKKSLNKS